MRRRPPDPASTIVALQVSLSAAYERIRELEAVASAMAERMAVANERADVAEMHLYALQQAAQNRAGVTPPFRDVSPLVPGWEAAEASVQRSRQAEAITLFF